MVQRSIASLQAEACEEVRRLVMSQIADQLLVVDLFPNGEEHLEPKDLHLVEAALAKLPSKKLECLAKGSGLSRRTTRSQELGGFELRFGPVSLIAWELVVERAEHDRLMSRISGEDNPTYASTEHQNAVQSSWEKCLAVRSRVDAFRHASSFCDTAHAK